MPRLTKIYTRKGDAGDTSLGGGQRVPKENLRVAAYGTVDELNSHLGVALAGGLDDRLRQVLPEIQNELFDLGSDLCFLEEDKHDVSAAPDRAAPCGRLEALIDECRQWWPAGELHPARRGAGRGAAPRGAHRLPPRRARC